MAVSLISPFATPFAISDLNRMMERFLSIFYHPGANLSLTICFTPFVGFGFLGVFALFDIDRYGRFGLVHHFVLLYPIFDHESLN